MTRAKRPPDFEKSLAELEALIERLESGDLPLEESLKAFERGVTLTRECQSALEAAQARVEILTRSQEGEARLTPFETDEDDEGLEDTEDGSSRND